MRARSLVFAAVLVMALPAAAVDKIPVVDEGGIGPQWTLVPGTQVVPPYPPQFASAPEDVCLVVGYLVNADGTTSDFSLLKSWTSGDNSSARAEYWEAFGDLASRAIAQWRYAPAAGASSLPVYTAVTFAFGDPQTVARTKARCALSGLAARLFELRFDARANRRMAGGIFSRLEIDPYLENRRQQALAWRRETLERAAMARSAEEQRSDQSKEHPIEAQ